MSVQTQKEILVERRRLKAIYQELFDAAAALLFHHDPMGINFGTNEDEYELEVETILPRLKACESEGDVCRVVHEEFERWFGNNAGTRENYAPIASELWRLWHEFNEKH